MSLNKALRRLVLLACFESLPCNAKRQVSSMYHEDILAEVERQVNVTPKLAEEKSVETSEAVVQLLNDSNSSEAALLEEQEREEEGTAGISYCCLCNRLWSSTTHVVAFCRGPRDCITSGPDQGCSDCKKYRKGHGFGTLKFIHLDYERFVKKHPETKNNVHRCSLIYPQKVHYNASDSSWHNNAWESVPTTKALQGDKKMMEERNAKTKTEKMKKEKEKEEKSKKEKANKIEERNAKTKAEKTTKEQENEEKAKKEKVSKIEERNAKTKAERMNKEQEKEEKAQKVEVKKILDENSGTSSSDDLVSGDNSQVKRSHGQVPPPMRSAPPRYWRKRAKMYLPTSLFQFLFQEGTKQEFAEANHHDGSRRDARSALSTEDQSIDHRHASREVVHSKLTLAMSPTVIGILGACSVVLVACVIALCLDRFFGKQESQESPASQENSFTKSSSVEAK